MHSNQQLPGSALAEGRRNNPELAVRCKRRTAAMLAGVVLGMVGLSFAAVPLYRLFCQVTGYGGTTQVATAAPEQSERRITVRFDANVAANMAWAFSAPKPVELALGETGVVSYTGRNPTSRPIVIIPACGLVLLLPKAALSAYHCCLCESGNSYSSHYYPFCQPK